MKIVDVLIPKVRNCEFLVFKNLIKISKYCDFEMKFDL